MLGRPDENKTDDGDSKILLAAQLITFPHPLPEPVLPFDLNSPLPLTRSTPQLSGDSTRSSKSGETFVNQITSMDVRRGLQEDDVSETQAAYFCQYLQSLKPSQVFEFFLQAILLSTLDAFLGYILLSSDDDIAENKLWLYSGIGAYTAVATTISLYYLFQYGPYDWNTGKLIERLHLINDTHIFYKNNLMEVKTLTTISNEIAKSAKLAKINLTKPRRIPKVKRHASCTEFSSIIVGYLSDFAIGCAAGISIDKIFDLDSQEAFRYLPAPVVLGLVNGFIKLTIYLLIRNQKVFLPCYAMVAYAFEETQFQRDLLVLIEKSRDSIQDKISTLRTVMSEVHEADSVLQALLRYKGIAKPRIRASDILQSADSVSPALSRRSFGGRSSGTATPNSSEPKPHRSRVAPYSRSAQFISMTPLAPIRSLSTDAKIGHHHYATFNSINPHTALNHALSSDDDNAMSLSLSSDDSSFFEEKSEPPTGNCCVDLLNTVVGLYPIFLAEISASINLYSRVESNSDANYFYICMVALYTMQLISIYWRTRQYGAFEGVSALNDFTIHSGKKFTQELEDLLINYKTRDLQLNQIIEQASIFLIQVNAKTLPTLRMDSNLKQRELIFDWLYKKNNTSAGCLSGLFAVREDLAVKKVQNHFKKLTDMRFNGVTFMIYWKNLEPAAQADLWKSYLRVHPEAVEPAGPLVPPQLTLKRSVSGSRL
jgi:hypothetical protein